jgi:hypothetical protein
MTRGLAKTGQTIGLNPNGCFVSPAFRGPFLFFATKWKVNDKLFIRRQENNNTYKKLKVRQNNPCD